MSQAGSCIIKNHPGGHPQGPRGQRQADIDPDEKAQHDKPKRYNNPLVRGGYTVVLAAGIGLGVASCGNSDTADRPAPTAETASHPGQTPDTPVTNNPETEPTDMPSFNDEAPSVEVDPYAIDFYEMSNQEILAKYTFDTNFVNAQGSPWVLEQMRLLGSEPPLVNAQLMWDTDQNNPETKDTGEVPMYYQAEEAGHVFFYETLNNNLTVAMNVILANRDIINQTEAAESSIIMRGVTVDLIRGREQAMSKQIEYFDPRDESTVQKLIEIVNAHPAGSVFTEVCTKINTDTSGNNPDYGTTVTYGVRTLDSSPDEIEFYSTKLAKQPVQHYNLEEKYITDTGPAGQRTTWYENNFWDPYDAQSPLAKSLFSRDQMNQ